MNNDFILSCCSTADISKEHFESRNIKYCCYHYFLNGVEHKDDLGVSMSFDDFYEAMANGADTKTSQINAAEFEEYFEAFLKEGKDVLHVSMSSGISGTYTSACIAAADLREKYPERKLHLIDTKGIPKK